MHPTTDVSMLQPLATLMLASAVVMGSPGPSTMSAMAVCAAFGWRRSLAYVLGLIAGTMAILISVAAGVVAMLLSQPGLARALIYASAAYILYLAFRIAKAPPLIGQAPAVSAPSFVPGLVLGVANPKAWLSIAAVFAASTLVDGSKARDGLLKVAVLTVMIVAIHAVWVMAGASLARVLRNPRTSRVANITFAAILAATAIALPLR